MEVIMYLSQLNQNPNHAPALVIEAPKKVSSFVSSEPGWGKSGPAYDG